MLWQLWWVWAAAALVLGILEVVVPGYIFLGFAAGALATAIVLLVGGPLAAALGVSVPLLLLFFALASLAGWYVLRRIFGLPGAQPKIWDRDINDT